MKINYIKKVPIGYMKFMYKLMDKLCQQLCSVVHCLVWKVILYTGMYIYYDQILTILKDYLLTMHFYIHEN